MFTGCSSDSKKVENAELKVQDAKADVKEAKQDLAETQQAAPISDFQKFKNESNEEINENDRKIAQLRIDIKNEKAEASAKDAKKIDALEKKNHDLKVKLDAYNDDGKSDWKEFKKEFKHDMDGIGHAFKDITVRNTK
jgi:hypothetical protein